MKYECEKACTRMAIKRAKKSGDPEKGFQHIKQWGERHPNRDTKEITKYFRKWLKRQQLEQQAFEILSLSMEYNGEESEVLEQIKSADDNTLLKFINEN